MSMLPVAFIKTSVEFEMREISETRWVYVLQCEQTRRIKIGIADHVGRRMAEIQSTSPTKLSLMFGFPVESQTVEAQLHRQFKECRIHGEWFTPTVEMLAELRSLSSALCDLLLTHRPEFLEQPGQRSAGP